MDADAIPSLSRSTVDAAGHRRVDEEWLAKAWADPDSQVLVLEGGDPGSHGWQALMARQSRALVTTGDTRDLVLTGTRDAPEGERYLLGAEGDRA
ncbi:NADH pyrophosphatase, partial [Nocardiopsis tropica]|nr:NADH pyrophosphatase [Nocardiopsis tropica]